MIKEHSKEWSWVQFSWAVSVVVIVPNAVMSIVALFYNLERPVLNVDYSVVMLVFLLNQRVLGVASLFVVFFFDVLAMVGQVFPILRLSDIPYLTKYIGVAPVAYKISIIISFLAFIAMVYLFLYRNRERARLEFLVCINIIVFTYGINAIFFNEEEARIWSGADRAFISSQLIYGIDSRRTGFVESLFVDGELFGDASLNGVTRHWFDDIGEVDDRTLLIINESWGASSRRIQSAVLAPLLESSSEIADWSEGTLSFSGMTVAAEIRELCRADLMHFNFDGHENELGNCIPNRLKKEGFRTFAFHGAAGLMYDRVKWYPDIGFDKSTFLESYPWESRCYSFPGACDVDVIQKVSDSYRGKGRVFGYWLTLNTHHYYDLRDLSMDVLQCGDIDVDPSSETCRNLKLQNQFFKSLANMVSRPHMEGVRVLVVSDHEPRISDQAQMDKYFKQGRVPWVSFKVR